MPRSVSFTVAVALCLALATSAQAQIPNPLRRAKAKAAQALSGQPANGPAPKFDNVVLELTPRVIDQTIAGLRVRALAKGPDGRTVADMRRRANELYEESRQLNENRETDRTEFENKRGEANSCMSEILQGLKNEQYQAFQRRIMGMTGVNMGGDQSANAKFMQEYQRVGMDLAAAYAANDTVKAAKLQAELDKLMGFTPKADSAKARARCNQPVAPPWMVRADAARDSSNTLFTIARDVEVAASDSAVRVSGLGADQLSMAFERLTAYAAIANGGVRGVMRFTAAEEVAIKARWVEIKPLII